MISLRNSIRKIYLIISYCSILSSGLLAQTKGAQIKTPSPQSGEGRGEAYAVVIGISDYQDPGIPDLRFADKDAEAFANYLRSDAGGNLDNDHLKVLINENATMAQFASALDWLWEVCKEGDQAIIYFSGHGDVEKKSLTQPGFLLCWDSPSRVYMAGGAFPVHMLQEVITTLSTKNKSKVLIIADACRSGKLAGHAVDGSQTTNANLARQFSNEVKILSCQPNEFSIEGEQWGGGRGVFSYHLINAMYGLADHNADNWLTLNEIGRYLDDRIPVEASPLSQNPVIVGNKSEKICKTSYEKADSLFKANKQQLPYLSAVDMRGLDSEIISQADSNTQEFYQKFNLRIKEKKFFQPDADCAEYYYGLLTANSQISKLHLTLKRNYAAALQDEVQQYVNHLLKADVKIIECQGFKSFLPNAAYLKRAKELLGSSHYMYRLLLARELLCQGIAFSFEKDNAVSLDSALYFLSLARELEPENPVVYYFMQRIFVYRQMVDSANYYQNICHQLAPEWILPYTGVVGELITNPDLKNLGESWMKQAAAIDSLHPHISHFNAWLLIEEGKYLEAAEQMNLYLKRGGETYACWYGTLGNIYYNLRGKEKEAEAAFLKAIELDNTRPIFYYNLAMVNMIIYENERSDSFMKKAILLEPNNPQWKIAMNWNYMYMGKFNEAELLNISEFKITGDTIGLWNDLCKNYLLTEKYNLVDSITLLMDQAGKFKYTSLRRKAQNEFCRNNIPSAYDYFSKVYRDKPKDKVSCIYLAYLDWLSGDHELSRDKIGKYFINGFDVAIVEKDIEFKMLRRKSNWIEFNNYLLQIRNEIGNK